MTKIFHICGLSLAAFLFSGTVHADGKTKNPFKNSKGKVVGSVSMTEDTTGVKLGLKLAGLKPGTYAMHIHNVGKCETPTFESAGPHFNPEKRQHGSKNPKGAHAGDLPNVTVAADGSLSTTVVAKNVTLQAGESNSLLTPEGTALVIHEKPDDKKTEPAGNAGDRILCAVLTGPQVANQ